MLIKKVKIENFGPFVGKHELEFSINEEKKLNVIIGPNGSGKTQLFNAMLWCLYGEAGTHFYQSPNAELLSLNDSIVNNLSNDQTATTKVEMNIIIENKLHMAKREIQFKKIDGKITVDYPTSNKDLASILPSQSFIFVKNIGRVIENFNKKKIYSEKLDKIIQKMNLIRQKSQFKYFANSEFMNIDNTIQLIGDGGTLESQALGKKVTLDFMFLSSIREVLIPNSVLIVDGPFHYTSPEFITPISNFLLEYLPQVIFFTTDLQYQNFEIKQGIAYELIKNQETLSTTIKRIESKEVTESQKQIRRIIKENSKLLKDLAKEKKV